MLSASELIDEAESTSGLSDFGGDSFRLGLGTLMESLEETAELTPMGEAILGGRLRSLLVNRLRIEDVYRQHPSIADEKIDGPIFILGLPRTGTTALSHLVASDPQIRSLRVWESSDPVPPPETATEHADPRISATAAGLDMMYQTFPRMASLYFQEATGPTECQDLLGMEFATAHFDGMANVARYTDWVLSADMRPAYRYHRRVLQLLQWHCPPTLWHLKTPVHLLALDALVTQYPDAKFLWTHRDPAEVLGSVCDLIAYTRSWVSDRDDTAELGGQQASLWAEALRRGLAFRDREGDGRFADVRFEDLNADPVATVSEAFRHIGLTVSAEGEARMRRWSARNAKGAHGAHEYAIDTFGITAEAVRERFAFYVDRFGL